MLTLRAKERRSPSRKNANWQRDYRRFAEINGLHSFKDAVPEGFVDYQARIRPGGEVCYFNFTLAKEMGLIPKNHPHRLNRKLCDAILETFCIQIINEWDVLHKTKIDPKTIKPHRYMATRYLQLQHPGRTGKTSGDGRSIWNGQIKSGGKTWDVSSCGTGATRLSPATAAEKKFFKTGDKKVCYGCGYSDLVDGLSAAFMSEIFHRNGVPTERTLAVIEFESGHSINVRAAPNLLRPSHFFHHLKQENYDDLKASIDYFIDRQVSNGAWPKTRGKNRYQIMAEQIAITFAKMAARFESEYLFVWLDWDGDNILADGGIIDYGSVRQFGLYHHEYRYDDVDRWSTNIPEQCHKARYIVQTFAQIKNYLETGKKRNLKKFRNDPMVKLFNQTLENARRENLVRKLGFSSKQCDYLLKTHKRAIDRFQKVFSYFERAKSGRGQYKVADGITWDAIYCMRDVLRELPLAFLEKEVLSTEDFLHIALSSYSSRRDRIITPAKSKRISEFQKFYRKLAEQVAKQERKTLKKVFLDMGMRSSVINRYDRMTGDAAIEVCEQMVKAKKAMNPNQANQMVEDFIEYQALIPQKNSIENRKTDRIQKKILKLVIDNRESI